MLKTGAQIIANRRPVYRISKKPPQHLVDTLTVGALGQHVRPPVQRLNDTHGRPVGPIEAAGGRISEMDLLVADLDRLQASVSQHLDARRRGGRESLAAVMPSTRVRLVSCRATARMTAR